MSTPNVTVIDCADEAAKRSTSKPKSQYKLKQKSTSRLYYDKRPKLSNQYSKM